MLSNEVVIKIFVHLVIPMYELELMTTLNFCV